jgi:hypothetical protein
MRIVPFLIAVAVIAIRFRPTAKPRLMALFAGLGLAFFLVRVGGNTVSFWLIDRSYDRHLTALDHIPRGARLATMVGERCGAPWMLSRLPHLPALALVRKEAFSNDQWEMPGAQLLRVRYVEGAPFTADPSQIVTLFQCPRERWFPINEALARLPRDAFDYVWLIRPPPFDPKLTAGLRPMWRSGRSVLYRVERR